MFPVYNYCATSSLPKTINTPSPSTMTPIYQSSNYPTFPGCVLLPGQILHTPIYSGILNYYFEVQIIAIYLYIYVKQKNTKGSYDHYHDVLHGFEMIIFIRRYTIIINKIFLASTLSASEVHHLEDP